MGIRGIGNSVTLCSIMGLLLVGVIFATSIPSAEAVDVPIYPIFVSEGNFKQWQLFPATCIFPLTQEQCKINAISDYGVPATTDPTGLFATANNQKNTFKLNLSNYPNLPPNVQIKNVLMEATLKKGDTFSGTTKVKLMVEFGPKKISLGSDIFLQSAQKVFFRDMPKDPFTKGNWLFSNLIKYGYGIDQVTDNKQSNLYKLQVIVTIVDDPPVITLNPPNPHNWLAGTDPYVDPGATASDVPDGTIDPSSIEISGDIVDPATPAQYTLNYDVTDSSGNDAVTKKRTVNVVNYEFDSTRYEIDGQGFITVEDYGAGSGPVSVILRSQLTGDSISVSLDETSTGIFVNTDPINFVLTKTGLPNELQIEPRDTVFASYLGFVDERSTAILDTGLVPGSFPGDPGNIEDKILFNESDVYYLLQAATLTVNDNDQVGDTIPVTIVSDVNVGGTTDDSITINAVRVPGTNRFVTPSVVFSEAFPADPSSSILVVPVGGGGVSATHEGFTATALIIPAPDVAELDPETFLPDTSRREVCSSSNPLNGADTDGDSICDLWETSSGVRVPTVGGPAGENYLWVCTGASYTTDPTGNTVCPVVGKKDLYVEIDYMEHHRPSNTAISDVVTAFRNSPVKNAAGTTVGIQLHVRVDDEMPHSRINPTSELPEVFDLLPWSSSDPDVVTFLTLKRQFFGTAADRSICDINIPACVDQIERMTTAMRQFVKYGEFAHQQLDFPLSSGYSERPGDQLLVTLGAFTFQVGSIDQQAATFMHELGHTLNLQHGGSDAINGKGNYPSVMNYAFQFDSTDGGLVSRPLDYSRAIYTKITETSLNEGTAITGSPSRTLVIGGYSGGVLLPLTISTGATPINYNRVSGTQSGFSQNTHYFDISGLRDTTIYGTGTTPSGLISQNDWTKLSFNHRIGTSFDTGIINIVGNDNPDVLQIGEVDPESIKPDINAGLDVEIGENQLYVQDLTIDDPHSTFWDVTIDYGDGTIDTFRISETTEIPDHQYNSGDYDVLVTVENEFGGIATDTLQVKVNLVYDSLTFQSPVPGAQYQEGRTVPVKFTVLEDDALVENLAPEIYVNGSDFIVRAGTSNSQTLNIADYDSTSISYHYNLETDNLPPGITTIIVRLGDGEDRTEEIELK